MLSKILTSPLSQISQTIHNSSNYHKRKRQYKWHSRHYSGFDEAKQYTLKKRFLNWSLFTLGIMGVASGYLFLQMTFSEHILKNLPNYDHYKDSPLDRSHVLQVYKNSILSKGWLNYLWVNDNMVTFLKSAIRDKEPYIQDEAAECIYMLIDNNISRERAIEEGLINEALQICNEISIGKYDPSSIIYLKIAARTSTDETVSVNIQKNINTYLNFLEKGDSIARSYSFQVLANTLELNREFLNECDTQRVLKILENEQELLQKDQSIFRETTIHNIRRIADLLEVRRSDLVDLKELRERLHQLDSSYNDLVRSLKVIFPAMAFSILWGTMRGLLANGRLTGGLKASYGTIFFLGFTTLIEQYSKYVQERQNDKLICVSLIPIELFSTLAFLFIQLTYLPYSLIPSLASSGLYIWMFNPREPILEEEVREQLEALKNTMGLD